MRTIIDNIEYEDNKVIVTCNVNIGQFRGVWKGEKPPIVNDNYHIELDIKKISSDKVKVLSSDMENESSVSCSLNEAVFKGICEAYDGEVYYIRFMIDWLEMLDIEGLDYTINLGDTVLFQVDIENIGIYPYELD